MRTLNILAPKRYPWRFNSPRHSHHHISRRIFMPFNRLTPKIEGITILNPLPLKRFDLIHAFNRIPLGRLPYVISFESHLPRGFGIEESAFFRAMVRSLAGERCRAIVAISQFAVRQFLHQHRASPHLDTLLGKLQVRYPNIELPTAPDCFSMHEKAPIRLVFVGNHFARKGGLIALRLAELAQQRGMRLEVEIISSLAMGEVSWVDPLRRGYFDRYRRLLHLPNVIAHGPRPNTEVITAMANAHFLLLPTFSDTFGFSAIEAMAYSTPVIATSQGALNEFVTPENGILLPLPTDEQGEWIHLGQHNRASTAYETIYDEAVETLAHAALRQIETLQQTPQCYLQLRRNARATAERMFNSSDASIFWDNLYCQAI